MKKKWTWILVVGLAILAVAFYFRSDILQRVSGQQDGVVSAAQARSDRPDEANLATTTIRPATDSAQVSAAGNIEVANQLSAVLQVEGIITEVPVEVGDIVSAGDLLVALDTADLERAVQRTELELETSQAQLDKLLEPSEAAEIAAARAKLASAKENLIDIKAGPGLAELAAAEAALAAAREGYQEVLDGQSEAELTQLAVEFRKITLTLQQAQEAYNEIAFRDDIGATQQAMDLQNATIDYEAAKAAYEAATEPASQADLQNALKEIREAESQLESLRNQPSEAELAEAEATVASAEAELAGLLNGPTESELREAELNLEQTRLDLEEAEAQLAKARLRAPAGGTILTVDVEAGQQATSGLIAIALADLTDLEL
ncbi:MAG: biotin/lipoyl-binding protein, partial [Anaerolineae bacterium]|nr:biotin/lipoyl-binding protein [Anaerolineae bacterium]